MAPQRWHPSNDTQQWHRAMAPQHGPAMAPSNGTQREPRQSWYPPPLLLEARTPKAKAGEICSFARYWTGNVVWPFINATKRPPLQPLLVFLQESPWKTWWLWESNVGGYPNCQCHIWAYPLTTLWHLIFHDSAEIIVSSFLLGIFWLSLQTFEAKCCSGSGIHQVAKKTSAHFTPCLRLFESSVQCWIEAVLFCNSSTQEYPRLAASRNTDMIII